MFYRKFGKRALDVFLSLLGLIIVCLPCVIIALAVWLTSKGPVIFKQTRLGKNRKEFTIYKFRSMVNNAFEIGGTNTYEGDERITPVGAVLRKTSLDEVPQLINILKGDMSIIGPRPILPMEFDEYSDNAHYDKRHAVRPGLFCTVDLDLRAMAERTIQFEMDVEYVENISFFSDVKIFFKIIKTVLLGVNVYKTEVPQQETAQEDEVARR